MGIFNVVDVNENNQVRRLIEVECPRVTREDFEWEKMPNGVKVIIRKAKAFDEAKIKNVYPIKQHFGVWEHEFGFNHREEGRFELLEDQISLKNGVLTIVLARIVHAKKGRLSSIPESTKFVPPPRTYGDGMQAPCSFPADSYVIPPTVSPSVCSESTEMSC